jgi:hypothetical protein
MKKLILLISALAFVASCSTTTSFKVPKGADLFVDGQKVPEAMHAEYTRSPMFWDKSKGIPYVLKKKGKVIDQGKIKAHFRVASIFWPPAAIIYWPMRFEPNYDFTSSDDMKVRPEQNYVEAKHRK